MSSQLKSLLLVLLGMMFVACGGGTGGTGGSSGVRSERVQGRIVSSEGQALADVEVGVPGAEAMDVTDDEGEFDLFVEVEGNLLILVFEDEELGGEVEVEIELLEGEDPDDLVSVELEFDAETGELLVVSLEFIEETEF